MLVSSFLLLIILGALGLKLLPGLYTGAPLSWTDSFFTATSAVCVTGLIVVDTATYFTPLGQAFILLLIQLGGLGILTLTSLVIVALGRRLSLRRETLASAGSRLGYQIEPGVLVRRVVLLTAFFEVAGALLLYLDWIPEMGPRRALWPAIFHAISAFCNAGFSVFSDSLMRFQLQPVTLTVVMLLVVVGGMGFLALEELRERWLLGSANRPLPLSLHSRLVVIMTAVLVAAGAMLFLIMEWKLTLAGLPGWARAFNAVFMSVTPRTAGFNTVDYSQVSEGTAFLTILLMFVGGSPGSMAGGIKTTTAALIVLVAWSRLRGQHVSSAWGRSVPEETVQRAVGVTVLAFAVVTGAIFIFSAIESGRVVHSEGGGFLAHMFEAASAFSTVGLSMGATPDLSSAGKWLTILLMYVGRVGPLTFAASIALAAPRPGARFRYAYEDVAIG
ncbi:MAG: TrkH family potassium uptake protein [Longimicrobiales bacterium]